jgi:OOP family OmpA-OmpF porin
MDLLKRPNVLLWIGVAGLLLTCIYAVWIGPASAASIQARVQAAADDTLRINGAQGMQARADGQTVRLTGVVSGEADRDRLAERVLASMGPGGVLQGGVTTVSTDGVVVAPAMAPFAWKASRDANRITIEGAVPSSDDKAFIEETARTMFSQGVVTSNMQLASGAPVGLTWRLAAIQGLSALQPLLRGEARLVDRNLTVTGVAPTDAAVAQVTELLATTGQGVVAISQVTGPPEWTARLADGKLTFSGRIATTTAQRNLAAAATRVFRGQFADQANVGTAGGWSGRAIAAMPQFSQFISGDIAAQGRRFLISGEAPESVLAYLKEDMNRVVDTYTVEYDVRIATPALPEIEGVNLSPGAPNLQESCQNAFRSVMAANRILFGNNNAVITRPSGEALDKVAEVARRCSSFKLEVQGYTDNRGRRAANVRLSQRRAEAVRAWLQDKGVPAERLTAVGRGPDNPIASNTRESGRAQNRRIEFRVTG